MGNIRWVLRENVKPGYWDFQLLKEHLETDLELEMNVYDNTCRIKNKSSTEEGKFEKTWEASRLS